MSRGHDHSGENAYSIREDVPTIYFSAGQRAANESREPRGEPQCR